MSEKPDLLTVKVLFENWNKQKAERAKYEEKVRTLYSEMHYAKRSAEGYKVHEEKALASLVEYAPDYEKIMHRAHWQDY